MFSRAILCYLSPNLVLLLARLPLPHGQGPHGQDPHEQGLGPTLQGPLGVMPFQP